MIVLLTNRNVLAVSHMIAIEMEVKPESRLLIMMPLTHSAPLNLFFVTAILVGAKAVFTPTFTPYLFIDTVETYRTTHFFGATFLTERQGGSDVGANRVEARLEGGQWRIYGEKYFASNAGYIEDFVMARLLRDAQVLTVWEGPSNILAHELTRLARKNAHQSLLTELGHTTHPALQTRVADLQDKFRQFDKLPDAIQTLEAKPLMVELTQLFEAVCAVRHGELHGEREQKLAEIYIETYLGNRSFGEVPLAVKYYSEI